MTTSNRSLYSPIASLVSLAAVIALASCASQPPVIASFGHGDRSFILAVDGLVESGLAQALCKAFARSEAASVRVVQADSSDSLRLLEQNAADAALVRTTAIEGAAVQERWAGNQRLIGAQRFVILGPPEDPAGVRGAFCSLDAFRRIHRSQAAFVSPADDSAAYRKELETWERARVSPWGGWYMTGISPAAGSLAKADAIGGYVLAGAHGTFAAAAPHLTVLFGDGEGLIDPYYVLWPASGATTEQETAAKFAAFLVSESGQRIIRDFGTERFGAPLYKDADSARAYLDQR